MKRSDICLILIFWAGVASGLSVLMETTARAQANPAPSVHITQPSRDGTSYTEGKSILLSATATDPFGVVSEVDFFSGTNLLATLSSPPYSLSLSNLVVGLYAFQALAINNAGVSATSKVVHAYVVLPPPFLTNSIHLSGVPTVALDTAENLYVAGEGMYQAGFVYSLTPSFVTNWVFQSETPAVAPPVISAAGSIYVALENQVSMAAHRLLSLNLNGTSNWVAELNAHLSSAPAVGFDGSVYVQTDDTVLYCLRSDGTKAWTNGVPSVLQGERFPSPAIAPDGTIYCTSSNGLRAVNEDGRTKWFVPLGPVFASPIVGASGEIYLGTYDGVAYRISPYGNIEWQQPLLDPNRNPPSGQPPVPAIMDLPACLGSNNEVYFVSWGGGSGSLHCLDISTGDSCWSFPNGIGYSPIGSMLIDQAGIVYVPTQDNLIFVDQNGNETGGFYGPTSFYPSALAVSSAGILYYGTAAGWLFAFAGAHPLADSPWPMLSHDAQHSGRAPQRRISVQRTDLGSVTVVSNLEKAEPHAIESSLDRKSWQTITAVAATNHAQVVVRTSANEQQFFRLRFAR